MAFFPTGGIFRVSTSFVAVVLVGHDPTRYTFYSKGALRYGFDHYAPGTPLAQGDDG